MRVAMIVVLALVAVVAVQAQSFERDVVSLNAWQSENIPFNSNAGTGRPAVWQVQADGVEVRQDINSEPSIFFNPERSESSSFTATVAVNSASDDDFVGFALGFQEGDWTNPNADWILIDWKQADQLEANEGAGRIGLAVSRVQGAITDNTALYAHTGPVTEIARAQTLGSTGWEDNTEHLFRITLTGNRLYVVVDGQTQFDLTDDASDMFPAEANIGFYVFSQQDTVFQLVEAQQLEDSVEGEVKDFNVLINEADSEGNYTLETTFPDGSVSAQEFDSGDGIRTVPLSYTFAAGLRTVAVRLFDSDDTLLDEKPILFDVAAVDDNGEGDGETPPTPDDCSISIVSTSQLDANNGQVSAESSTTCACLQFVQ